jgi:hypothetical protein
MLCIYTLRVGGGVCRAGTKCKFHLRPYRDEPSASRPIRADKHRRGQRVLTWVTSREHCAAAGFFLLLFTMIMNMGSQNIFLVLLSCTGLVLGHRAWHRPAYTQPGAARAAKGGLLSCLSQWSTAPGTLAHGSYYRAEHVPAMVKCHSTGYRKCAAPLRPGAGLVG